ncbi:MAG: ubiquinol-cytochrome C reductase, partial [Actinomycetota bacterium]|nr:ubiquinol-cytochrome C reductase [Actinomycetota bacterium]
MSLQPIQDPGLPTHVHRRADTDPIAAKRAERQVASLFLTSALGTILFIYAYVGIPRDQLLFLPVIG